MNIFMIFDQILGIKFDR